MAARRWCAANRRHLWSETGRKKIRTSTGTTQRSFWHKNVEKWWTTEPWPRHRWPRRSSDVVSSRRRRQCGLTEARQPQPTRRREREEAGGALGGVARPEVPRHERASLPKQRQWREEDDEREREGTRVEMALSTRSGVPWRPVGHAGSWRVGQMATYGCHESRHAASPASSPPPLLTPPPFSYRADWNSILDFDYLLNHSMILLANCSML